MTMNNLIPIAFNGDTIFAVQRPEGVFIVAKPIAERFGLAWQRQLERLKEDPVLSEGITMVVIPSPGGPQETTCLRLDLLNGWLFKIDSRRVKEEAREALIAYQRECYAVLFRHFQPTAAEGIGTVSTPLRFGEDLNTRDWLALIRETRILHGVSAGRRMWALSPLPNVAGRVLAAADPAEGWACLDVLLSAEIEGEALAAWLRRGEDDVALAHAGLRLLPGGLFVGNAAAVFAPSRFAGGLHRAALLSLTGVVRDETVRTLAGTATRGLIVPLALLFDAQAMEGDHA